MASAYADCNFELRCINRLMIIVLNLGSPATRGHCEQERAERVKAGVEEARKKRKLEVRRRIHRSHSSNSYRRTLLPVPSKMHSDFENHSAGSQEGKTRRCCSHSCQESKGSTIMERLWLMRDSTLLTKNRKLVFFVVRGRDLILA